MTATKPRRRRARLGVAAVAMTVAGLAVTGGAASASTPYFDPDRATLTVAQPDTDVTYIDSIRRVLLQPEVLKTDVCVRGLGGTFQTVPARLCP